jgi:hypothetical protein
MSKAKRSVEVRSTELPSTDVVKSGDQSSIVEVDGRHCQLLIIVACRKGAWGANLNSNMVFPLIKVEDCLGVRSKRLL